MQFRVRVPLAKVVDTATAGLPGACGRRLMPRITTVKRIPGSQISDHRISGVDDMKVLSTSISKEDSACLSCVVVNLAKS